MRWRLERRLFRREQDCRHPGQDAQGGRKFGIESGVRDTSWRNQVHFEPLEEVVNFIGKNPEKKTCAAILGITDEGAEIMEDYEGSPALEAGLWAVAQSVEHYEMPRYGTLRNRMKDAAKLLQTTLDEATDIALTGIATSIINQKTEGLRAL